MTTDSQRRTTGSGKGGKRDWFSGCILIFALPFVLLLCLLSRGYYDRKYYTPGVQYYQAGQYDKAISALTTYNQGYGNPLFVPLTKAHYYLGLCYERKGMKSEAIQEMEITYKKANKSSGHSGGDHELTAEAQEQLEAMGIPDAAYQH